MTYDAAKEHLHFFIEKADKSKVMAMYTLLVNDIKVEESFYDEATLSELEKISNDAFSGLTETLTMEQMFANLSARRKNNGQ